VSFAKALRRYVTAEKSAGSAAETAAVKPGARVGGAGSVAVIPNLGWRIQAFSSSYLRIAAAAVILLAIGIGSWRTYVYLRQPQISKGIASLRQAYRDQRPTEARITQLDYAPPPPTTRGPERDKFDYIALDRAKALIQVEANEHPSAKSYHDLGRLYLAQGEYDKAIDQFEKAAKLDEKNAQLQSDYGAAFLEFGKECEAKEERGKSLEQYSKSLEHLNRAIELDTSLLEALFNRALCHEYMMLPPEQSAKDWHLYLERDSSSRWADEARHRLEELEKRKSKVSQTREELYEQFLSAYYTGDRETAWGVLSKSRARVGNSTTEKLVDALLEPSPAVSSEQSKDKLATLLYAGELEVEKGGDRFTFDLARFYERAGHANQAGLRRARELVTIGQTQIAQSDFKAAFESYEQAKGVFDESGNKGESMFAEYWLAICRTQDVDPRQGSMKFREILEECEKDNYKWLAVRASNALANHNLVLNEYSEAISYSSRSNILAQQIQDTYGQVIALSDLVRAYSSLGDHRQTLNYVEQLLRLAAETSLEPIQTCLCFARTAWTMYSEGLIAGSLEYQKAALEVALQLNELRMICTSYAHLGMIYAKLSKFDQALANANRALEVAGGRSDERTGSLMAAYSTLHLGSLYRQLGDVPEAIANYNRSIGIYTLLNHPSFIHEAHKGLVLSYIASGDTSAASEELTKAIEYYEQHRARILEQDNRNSFFDLENDIYDIAMDFEYSNRGSSEKAFDYSELSRARSLLDIITRVGRLREGPDRSRRGSVTKPLTLSQIQERMPQRAQVIQYAVLQDKLLIWCLTKARFQSSQQSINSRFLDKLVQDYLRLVSTPGSDPAELSRLSKELHSILITPIEPFLSKDGQIFVVADKSVNNVPFQSLISPATGEYLIEDFALELSPSSSVLIACSETANRKGQPHRESILGLGVTHFKPEGSTRLPDLPSAGGEVRDIARNYSSSVVLVNSLCKKRDVLRELKKTNVIHIASHFIANDSSPLRSKLLLFSEPKDNQESEMPNEVLEASEIFNMKLPAATLAVLSACRTGIDRYYRGEGAIGFAHAFLAADVPLVVASLWAVDSEATTDLMIGFHRNRKRPGSSSVEALRSAQLAMLHGADSRYRHPFYWASFNLIGGYADY
jgi:CHAT domain-containing protein